MDTFRFRDDTGRSAMQELPEDVAIRTAMAWQMDQGRRMFLFRATAEGEVEVPVPAPLIRVSDPAATFRVNRRSA